MKLFPEFDEVFYQADDIHKMLLFPLSTVDLNSLNKGNGKVHFVSVCCVHEPSLPYHNPNLFNWDTIRFDWDGERYNFKGDLSIIPNFDKIPEWYAEAFQEYNQYKDEYCRLKTREEVKNSTFYIKHQNRKQIDWAYADYINSVINYWVTKDNYLATGKFIQGSAYLEDMSKHEREKFVEMDNEPTSNYIGRVQGYHYIDGGEDIIELFIDRENNQVYEMFDWT